MALTRFFTTSMILFSLLAIALASIGGYGPNPELEKPKPECNKGYDVKPAVEKPEPEYNKRYGSAPEAETPKPEYKKGYDLKLEMEKPEPEYKEGYGSKTEVEKPKPEYNKGYVPKPVVEKPKPEYKNKYGPKPEVEKPKPEYNNGYVPKPEVEKPKPEYQKEYGPKPEVEKPKPEYEKKLLPTAMGVQGLIYCKSGHKTTPLPGAVARITCLAADEQGYEMAPFSFLSGPSDEKGYYFATLYPSQVEDNCKLTQCKAFLENSPLKTCNVPTDENTGINGAPVIPYGNLKAKKMQLYSVKPLFYTSQPEPVSNGY